MGLLSSAGPTCYSMNDDSSIDNRTREQRWTRRLAKYACCLTVWIAAAALEHMVRPDRARPSELDDRAPLGRARAPTDAPAGERRAAPRRPRHAVDLFAHVRRGADRGDPLQARGTVAFFVLAALAKLAGTSVTLSAEWRGGFIIPRCSSSGACLARASHGAVPDATR